MGADVLVHEATNSNEERTVALQYGHSTAGMAGEFARRIQAKNLILTHFSPRNLNNDEYQECAHIRLLIEQARRSFGKNSVFAASVLLLFWFCINILLGSLEISDSKLA